MKTYKLFGGFFVAIIIALFSLVLIQPFGNSYATQVDACNQEFTYVVTDSNDYDPNTVTEPLNDSRVSVDIQDFGNDDDRRVVVDPKNGYKLIFLGVDYTGNDSNEVTPSVEDGYATITYTAPKNESIDRVTVVLKKICATSTPTATPEGKVYWCHCEPNGNCQTLHLPMSALTNAGHVNANGNPLHAGDYSGQCVSPTQSPTATPSLNPTTTPFSTWTPTATPCIDCNNPTDTPTPTATPVATVLDICANIEGIQTSVPEGKHLDAGKVNCVNFSPSGPSDSSSSNSGGGSVTPQVLGASTMAATGAFEESLFYSMFSLGSLLTSFGIMKNGKKKAILTN